MGAPELYLLFKFTGKFEYPLAASILALTLFFNIVIFYAFSSEALCTVLIVLIDIILAVSLIYLLFDNRRNKKKYIKTKN